MVAALTESHPDDSGSVVVSALNDLAGFFDGDVVSGKMKARRNNY